MGCSKFFGHIVSAHNGTYLLNIYIYSIRIVSPANIVGRKAYGSKSP